MEYLVQHTEMQRATEVSSRGAGTTTDIAPFDRAALKGRPTSKRVALAFKEVTNRLTSKNSGIGDGEPSGTGGGASA